MPCPSPVKPRALCLLLALLPALAVAQPGPADPGGVWMGQLATTSPARVWLVTMTLAMRGTEARGVLERFSLDGPEHTSTTLAGTWDAAEARAIVVERLLFGRPSDGETPVGVYSLRFPAGEPGTASCTYRSVAGETAGAACFTRVSPLAATPDFPGCWQSLPGPADPALSLRIVAAGAGLAATGTVLDPALGTLRHLTISAERLPDQPARCTLQTSLGDPALPPAAYDAYLEENGCLLRLSKDCQEVALLVRRSAAPEAASTPAPPPDEQPGPASTTSAQEPPTGPPAARGALPARCTGVSDGDTFTVICNGKELRIRLNGVDAPERYQPFAAASREFTSDAVLGKLIGLTPTDTDQYGRIVADVYLPDGESLNEALVNAGLAWWYRHYAPDNTRLEALEAAAREARRGLWADAHPTPPWEFRQQNR